MAPVAMMRVWALTVCEPVLTVKGRAERSTDSTSSVSTRVPKRTLCSRIRPMSSGPVMPSGKPGKFSTSVVVMSWPPATPPAMKPSNMRGDRLAREA